MDIEASKIAILTKISRKTINNYLLKIRERIAEFCCEGSHLSGIIEVDESVKSHLWCKFSHVLIILKNFLLT